MKIRRVVLTEEPYPTCVVSGKQLGHFSAVFEVTKEDETVVYVDHKSFIALNKS
jgi:hypothetical protein